MRLPFVLCFAAAAVGCALTPRQETPRELAQLRGEQVAHTNCGRCHAVGAGGESLDIKAPALRLLEARGYQVSGIRDVMTKGLTIGHPPMPTMQLPPKDVEALVAYVQSIQAPHQQ